MEKKDQKIRARVNPPAPHFRAMPELKPSFAIDVFPNPNLPQPNIPAKSLWNARGKFFPCTPPHPWHCHYSFDVFLTLKVASYSYLLRQCSWGQQAVFEPCHRSKNKTSGSIQLSGPKQLMTQCKNEARILSGGVRLHRLEKMPLYS